MMDAFEASKLQTLFEWLLHAGGPTGEVPTSNEAFEAARVLAAKSSDILGSGIDGHRFTKLWRSAAPRQATYREPR